MGDGNRVGVMALAIAGCVGLVLMLPGVASAQDTTPPPSVSVSEPAANAGAATNSSVATEPDPSSTASGSSQSASGSATSSSNPAAATRLVAVTPNAAPAVTCSSFASQEDAQRFLDLNGADFKPALDLDSNGLACETLPRRSSVTCSSFAFQEDAQAFFERDRSAFKLALDRDLDGIACGTLPRLASVTCGTFASQEDAQAFYDANGGVSGRFRTALDPDSNGIACDRLQSRATRCADFIFQEDAQAVYDANGGLSGRFRLALDRDGNGVACDGLPRRSTAVLADRDCRDFTSQADAQAFYEQSLAIYGRDRFNLDANNNGRACETFNYGTRVVVNQVPATVIGTPAIVAAAPSSPVSGVSAVQPLVAEPVVAQPLNLPLGGVATGDGSVVEAAQNSPASTSRIVGVVMIMLALAGGGAWLRSRRAG